MRPDSEAHGRDAVMMPKISYRLAIAGRAVIQGLSNFSADMRLLFRRRNDGPVLRQGRVDGFQMLVRVDEEVGRNIYYKGVHEKEESAFFRSVIGKSSICFDVGANVGYFSLLFASLCPQGTVHSFEPVPLNYHTLSTNKLLNGFTNMSASPCAVGEVEGQVGFVISSDSAYSSLVDTGRKPVLERIVVAMTTLDGYCEKQNVARVDVLKVDVEGAEERVIAGALNLLRDRARRPRTVMLELYEPMLQGNHSSIESILNQMHNLCYGPFVLWKGQLVPFTREHYNRFANVVFLDE
jgi:FkbM family methyltransferase